MAEDFGTRFIESEGRPIEYEGRLVHMMFQAPVGDYRSIRVVMTSRAETVQGLHIKAKGYRLQFDDDQSLDDVLLWTDTAPGELVVPLVRTRGATSLRFWNVWRDRHQVSQAWTGNAGIVISEVGPGRYGLGCSAGPGGPTFDDLSVDLHVETA